MIALNCKNWFFSECWFLYDFDNHFFYLNINLCVISSSSLYILILVIIIVILCPFLLTHDWLSILQSIKSITEGQVNYGFFEVFRVRKKSSCKRNKKQKKNETLTQTLPTHLYLSFKASSFCNLKLLVKNAKHYQSYRKINFRIYIFHFFSYVTSLLYKIFPCKLMFAAFQFFWCYFKILQKFFIW